MMTKKTLRIGKDEINELLEIQNGRGDKTTAFKKFLYARAKDLNMDDITFGAKLPNISHGAIRNIFETLNNLAANNNNLEIIVDKAVFDEYKNALDGNMFLSEISTDHLQIRPVEKSVADLASHENMMGKPSPESMLEVHNALNPEKEVKFGPEQANPEYNKALHAEPTQSSEAKLQQNETEIARQEFQANPEKFIFDVFNKLDLESIHILMSLDQGTEMIFKKLGLNTQAEQETHLEDINKYKSIMNDFAELSNFITNQFIRKQVITDKSKADDFMPMIEEKFKGNKTIQSQYFDKTIISKFIDNKIQKIIQNRKVFEENPEKFILELGLEYKARLDMMDSEYNENNLLNEIRQTLQYAYFTEEINKKVDEKLPEGKKRRNIINVLLNLDKFIKQAAQDIEFTNESNAEELAKASMPHIQAKLKEITGFNFQDIEGFNKVVVSALSGIINANKLFAEAPEAYLSEAYQNLYLTKNKITAENLLNKLKQKDISDKFLTDKSNIKLKQFCDNYISMLVNIDTHITAACIKLETSKKEINPENLRAQLKTDLKFDFSCEDKLENFINGRGIQKDIEAGNIDKYIVEAVNKSMSGYGKIIADDLTMALNEVFYNAFDKNMFGINEVKDLAKSVNKVIANKKITRENPITEKDMNSDISWKDTISAMLTYLLRKLHIVKGESQRAEKVTLKDAKSKIKNVVGKKTAKVLSNKSDTLSNKLPHK